MGNSDLTRATTTPRTSNHGRATKPRTSGTGRRLARGRCSHLLNHPRAPVSHLPGGVSRGDTSGGTGELCRALINAGFNRRLISQRRAAGLCGRCGAAAIQGQLNCVRCRDKARERYKPGRKLTATRKRLLARRTALSICTICCAPTATGRLRCVACLADSRARHRRDRAHWRAAGLCVSCGRTPRRGVKVCGVCAERKKKLRATNQAAGYCRCGRFVTPGRKSCAGCRAAAREYQRRRRA